MMNSGFILVFHGGDYMRKQNKPTVVNAIDEINLTDERWWAIIQNDASYNGVILYAVKQQSLFVFHPVSHVFQMEYVYCHY